MSIIIIIIWTASIKQRAVFNIEVNKK